MFVFHFSEIGPGGVQSLIIRIVRKLNENGQTAKILSVPDSFICRELDSTQNKYILINVNIVNPEKIAEHICADDIFVLMDVSLKYIPELRKVNSLVLFYSVFPSLFINKRFKNIASKESIRKFLHILNLKNSLYFMDYENYIVPNKYYNITLDPIRYIPIPVNTYSQNLYCCKNKCHIVTYIGRGSEVWKINPVKKILEDLSGCGFEGEFHIITDRTDYFEEILSHTKISSQIIIKYRLGLSGTKLDEYLFKYSDLHVAMGTSALEGAKMGIPTLLIDASFKDFPTNYLYRWLYYNNCNFSLGHLIESEGLLPGFSIKEILDDLENPDKIKQISENCFRYVNANHSMSKFYISFKEAEKNCQLHIQDLYQYRFFRVCAFYMELSRNLHKKYPYLVSFFRSLIHSTYKVIKNKSGIF